jgi:hypothetical protein
MAKSGIIIAVLAFFFAVGLVLLSPLCVPCVALFFGIAAGFLAGVLTKPEPDKPSMRMGAMAGGIGGIGAFLGQCVGAAINAAIMGPQGAAQFVQNMGGSVFANQGAFATSYWVGLIGGALCIGLIDVGLMIGFGALGYLLWSKTLKKNSTA